MFDVCIVRTTDGEEWSNYLESEFKIPKEDMEPTEPYKVRIFSVEKDGSLQLVNGSEEQVENISLRQATSKFLVVLVTPNLIKMLHDIKNLGFWNYDQTNTRRALFLCGIEPVQLFETDDTGRTLSERFLDYSSWTKYSHNNYDKLVDSAFAWIKSSDPVIPARKDTLTRSQNVSEGKDNDDNDSDDDDSDYILMQKPFSDEDKSSSKTSSRNIRDSNSSNELDEYIHKDELRKEQSRGSVYPDTYGIGPIRSSSQKKSSEKRKHADNSAEFTLIPGEAICEENTTITVVFKEPPLEKLDSAASKKEIRKAGNAIKIAMTDESFTRHLDLKWINPTVAFFQAPMHHPGTVQVKIVINNEDRFRCGVDLEYKRSLGVEEMVSEVSQIYLHLLSISFNMIKTSPLGHSPGTNSLPPSLGLHRGSLTTPSSFLGQLDKSLASVFRDSSDIDQFNVRAFEYFFGICNHFDADTSAHLPTALHLVAKHNLPQLASALLGLPDSNTALSILNSSKMTPVDLAKSLGHMEIVFLFEEFLGTGSINENASQGQDAEEGDQYIDMEKSDKKPRIVVENDDGEDAEDEADPLDKGALDKGQEELINIMDLFKRKDISMSEAQTLFREWQLRHQNDDSTKQALHKQEETRSLKKTLLGQFFGNKKSPSCDQNSCKNSKKHTLRISGQNDNELPIIPPRTTPTDECKPQLPHPPRRHLNNDYLVLRDNDDGDGTVHATNHPTDEDGEPLPTRPPRQRTVLKNIKQSSIPAHFNPPPQHNLNYRKCSLPEERLGVNRRLLQNFNSRLDSTSEMSESSPALNKEKPGHGYICMSSKGRNHKN